MFIKLLTILFIGLKITGYIGWNWFFIFLPLLVQWFFKIIIVICRLDKTQEEKEREDVLMIMERFRKRGKI